MTDITHPQLVAALVKPPLDIMNSLSPLTTDLWHGATGVAGECGELLEGIMIAHGRKDQIESELVIGRENALEESGDIYFYIEQLVQRTGIILDWDVIATFARNQHIGPDVMVTCAIHIAIYGSQVLDTVKKAAVYNKPLDYPLLTDQLTQLCKFLMTLGYIFGIERTEALRANVVKLSKRYEGLNYSDAAAQNRADKVPERQYFGKEPAVGDPVSVPVDGVNQAIADDLNAGRDPSEIGK